MKFIKIIGREIKLFFLALRLFFWNKIFSKIPFAVLRLFFARHYISLGKNANILTNVEFLFSGLSKSQIVLGENSVVNSFSLLDGRHEKIIIGSNVDIGRECAIFTLGHDPNNNDHNVKGASVNIEDHVWIAARVTILPGIKIGKGAVVAAGSVVSKSVDSMDIVAGNPAKVIGKRDSNLNYETKFFPYLR